MNWGFKTPSFLYLFDRLRPLFPDQDIRLIATTRDRDESIRSMMDMFNLLQAEATAMIDDFHRQQAHVKAVATDPLLEVNYNAAMADPGGLVPMIAKFLGLTPTPKAISFVNPSLRRYHLDMNEENHAAEDDSLDTRDVIRNTADSSPTRIE